MKNTYIYFRDDFTSAEFEFDPSDPTCLDHVGYTYPGRVFYHLEKMVPNQGLTIYLTGWTVHRLPTYGPKTIVFIMQDEWSREPRYRDKVGAIFHACSATPSSLQALGPGGPLENTMNILQYFRNIFRRDGLPGRIISLLKKGLGANLAPVYEFPLGYFANEPVEFIPFQDRPYLLSFAGSVEHKAASRILARPKELARSRMTQALNELKHKRPELKIHLKTTKNYKDSIGKTDSYNQTMMQSKFCLIPRGANLETFRYYEAIRFGCIPIVESYPKLPFYDDAPLVHIHRWSDLESTLDRELQDEAKLVQKHQQVLEWWHRICSESQVAKAVLGHFQTGTVVYGQ